MRVLLVNKFLYPRGGAEAYTLELGQALERMGHCVEYFGMADSRNTVGNSLGLYTSPVDFHTKKPENLLYPLRIIYSAEAKRKIKELCRSFKPDIVHMNNINFQLTPSVIDGVWELGIPVIQTVHDSQMVCPNHLMMSGNGELCQRCIGKGKWNCVFGKCIHGSYLKSIVGAVEGELYRQRKTYDRVSAFICPSRFIESVITRKSRFLGKTVVISNFVHKAVVSTSEKGDYVLYFGRLSKEKGIEIMIKAFNSLGHINFFIAGSGPMENYVRKEAGENVRYIGFKEGEELEKLIRHALFTV